MDQVVPWKKLCKIIKPYHQEPPTGRKPIAIERKLRIICLQQWYNLSDPGVEDAIYDRNSFQKFLSIDILTESVPDETTICNFRNLLQRHGLFEKILSTINEHLEQKGLLMKEGTAVDATLISAPSSTKNQSGKRDPEMSSTQKNGKWHFGMKAHVGVDPKSGLVHSLSATTAKIHDTHQFADLLHGEEKAILGDKGYLRRYLVTRVISAPHVKKICAIREYFAESWIKAAGTPPCQFRRKSEIVNCQEQELLLNIPFKSLSANGIIEKPVIEVLQKIPANSIYCLVSIICLEYAKSCY
jgi:IS5 family transposase